MKFCKKGFTLVEVLLSIGIIGVLAIIITPMLAKNVTEQKDRALLEKARAQITLGNQNIVQVSNMNSASARYTDLLAYIRAVDLDFAGAGAQSFLAPDFFYSILPGYWGVIEFNGNVQIPDNGVYRFYRFKNFPAGVAVRNDITPILNNIDAEADSETEDRASEPKTVITTILIDANGWDRRPNVLNNDIFMFNLLNDGSLVEQTPAES